MTLEIIEAFRLLAVVDLFIWILRVPGLYFQRMTNNHVFRK